MRFVVDLDGVICPLKLPHEKYGELKPNWEMVKLLKKFKKEGHYIIISTARHMKTCSNDVGKVIAEIGKITKKWLKKYKVPYDEIYFGKPYGDLYIDDLALTYKSATDLENNLKLLMPNFVIPMAGRGKRFQDAGYKIPKYMIEVCGRTMLEWSLRGLPLDMARKLIFVCLTEHQKKYNISKFIKKIIATNYPFLKKRYSIILLNKVTRGQVETVLAAKKYINNDNPLVIYNIDTYFESSRLRQRLISSGRQGIDGILGVFRDKNPKWSFVKLGSNGFVLKTTEKEPISDMASTGLYIFTRGRDFIEAAEYMIKNNLTTKNEFYVAPLYNILIKWGRRFIVDFAEKFWCLGTPEDLDNFLKNYEDGK